MSHKSSPFRHESLQDSKAIVRYLDALSEGFEKGTLQFRDQEGEIVLEPSGMIRFEVTASRKSGRYSMALKLSWKQGEEEGRDPGPLLINGEADPADDHETSPEVSADGAADAATEASADSASGAAAVGASSLRSKQPKKTRSNPSNAKTPKK